MTKETNFAVLLARALYYVNKSVKTRSMYSVSSTYAPDDKILYFRTFCTIRCVVIKIKISRDDTHRDVRECTKKKYLRVKLQQGAYTYASFDNTGISKRINNKMNQSCYPESRF